MTGLTFTEVKELNTGKDSALSLKFDYSGIDGKDFMKALEGANNAYSYNSSTTQNTYSPVYQESNNIYAPQNAAAHDLVVSNNFDYSQQNKESVNQPEIKDNSKTTNEILSLADKKEETSKTNHKKENSAETEKKSSAKNEEKAESSKTLKQQNSEEKETKKTENNLIKISVLTEKDISISEITAKSSSINSSNPKSDEISRESLGLKTSKDFLPESAIVNRNTEFGVKFGNTTENKTNKPDQKESKDKNSANIIIQNPAELKNAQKEPAQNKKIEVLVEDKQAEKLKNIINTDQQQLSTSTQKTLDDIFNKSGIAKPLVTKVDIQNTSDKPASQQKQGQNLFEDQASKLANQLLQTGEQNTSAITNNKDIVFGKILDSQITAKINSESILEQVSQKLSADVNVGKSEITMSLRPESLGKVEINLISEKGVINAEITAENSDVKEILTKEIDSLKQKLADQNINLDKVTIKIQEPSQTTNNNQNFDKESQNFDQKFQNMNNDSNFDSSKQTREKSGSDHINKMESSEDIDLNMANENNSGNIHNGLVDYTI